MSAIDLSIIIVNWHSAEYVLACVRSIREQASTLHYEVIVVDNDSSDGCGERLAREHPRVIFLQCRCNLGFARANNLGAEHAHGAVLLFLNPDTEVRDRAIERLYADFQRLPDAGVVGCRLLNSDGSVQTSCVQSLPTVLNQVLHTEILRRWFPKAGLWGTAALFRGGTTPVEVEAVSGACMMIRRDVYDRVGGFSSDYFMYTEDLDLCFKTRRAGFRNFHVGHVMIVHHGGGSSQWARSNFSNVMMRESVSRFLRKSRGGLYSGYYRFALSGAAAIRLALLLILTPAWLARHGARRWGTACRKWLAILRWGLGLARWTRQYDQLEAAVACPNHSAVKICAESPEN
jgi:GT2 family glycosyltransferase